MAEETQDKKEEKKETEQKKEEENQQNQEDQEESEDEETDEEENDEEGEDESAEQPEPPGPHFDAIEAFFYIAICGVLADIFDLTWVAQFLFTPMAFMWRYFKGVKNVGASTWILMIKLIPILGMILPAATVAAIMTVWETNNPESFRKTFGLAAKITEKIQKVKK